MAGASKVVGALSLVLVLSVLLAGCAGPRKVSDRDIEVVELDRVLEMAEAQGQKPEKRLLYLIDARSRLDYEQAHIPGARHMVLSDVDMELGRDPRLNAYENIVVYADNPGSAASRALAKRLLSLRYEDVWLFAGGLDQWKRAELPVETAN